MAKIYYDKDANLADIKDKTIAVVGYGIQGRGQALSLRDSGLKVIVAQRKGGPNYDQAVKDGFKPVDADVAAKQADVIMLLVQDHIQAGLYKESIKKHLKAGKALMFSHGFNIHFGGIKPPKDVDVFMIAPKGPGALVRRQYEEDTKAFHVWLRSIRMRPARPLKCARLCQRYRRYPRGCYSDHI